MKKRVGIVALLQESNTFVAQPTTLAHFEHETLLLGSKVRECFLHAYHEVGGFFAGLESAGIEAVPIFAARALPHGKMTADTFDALMDLLRSELSQAGVLDGLLVAPHGATVSEKVPDVDGYWLGMLREELGANCPIIGTLDPHANLSPAMVAACDALIAYRTNPHVDQRECGLEAARLITQALAGKIRPVQAAAYPPLVINIECQLPACPPCLPIYEAAKRIQDRANVLAVNICLGFPYADVLEMGAATLVVTDHDCDLAQQLSDQLANKLWLDRHEFVPQLLGIDTALDQIERLETAGQLDRPICLLDMGDNVGAGSAADGTYIAEALHFRKMQGAFVCLYDPAAVQQAAGASPGARLRLSVGAKSDAMHGRPLEANFTLLGIYDGKFTEREPRHGGISSFDQGLTAVVRTDDGLTCMLTSQRMAPWSLAQLRSCGIDPTSFRILVAKGVHSPIAAYREVCHQFVRVNTPGTTSADLSLFPYQNRRRRMFPFESDTVWDGRSDAPLAR